MNINNPKSKTAVLLVTVALLGALAGSGVTYTLLKDNSNSPANPADTPKLAGGEKTPDIISNPINYEDKIPEGTISPTVLAEKFAEYNGKEVKARGLLIEVSPGQYRLIGQEKQKAGSVRADFAETKADPKSYLSGYGYETDPNSQNQNTGPVTVTGTLVSDPKGPTLKVKDIQK